MNLSKNIVLRINLAFLVGATGLWSQAGKPQRKPVHSIMALDDYVPKAAVIFEGKWEPIDGKSNADGSIVWIRCDVSEMECIELDANPIMNSTLLWQTSYKIKSWDENEIIARGASLNGCTSQTLIANIKKGSMEAINSPATPYPTHCTQSDSDLQKLGMSKREMLEGQTEQDSLVPTKLFGIGDAPPLFPKPAITQR